MQIRHLEQAERHIAQGEGHIAEQENRIAKLARLGADTTEAQKLLNNFFANQIEHVRHHERILKELSSKVAPVGGSLLRK
jgi:ferritin